MQDTRLATCVDLWGLRSAERAALRAKMIFGICLRLTRGNCGLLTGKHEGHSDIQKYQGKGIANVCGSHIVTHVRLKKTRALLSLVMSWALSMATCCSPTKPQVQDNVQTH